MRSVRLAAVVAALALGSACGGPSATPAADPLPSAPQAAVETELPTTSPPTGDTVEPRPAAAAPLPVARTPAPPPATTPAADVGAAPPPPAGVVASRQAVVATARGAGTTVTLRVAPGEQFRGELFHTAVEVSGPTAIRSVTLDLGDGDVVDAEPAPTWACPEGPREVLAGPPAHLYRTPGRHTVTAMVTVVPCVYMPGPTGVSMPWVPSGPEQLLQARIDVVQRAESPPRS